MLSAIFQTRLGSNDVLLGRGTGSNDHAGNKKFRAMAAELLKHAQVSKAASHSSVSKLDLARKLVDLVHAKQGNFVRKLNRIEFNTLASDILKTPDKKVLKAYFIKGLYMVVPERTAMEKARQSFRHQLRLMISPPRGGYPEDLEGEERLVASRTVSNLSVSKRSCDQGETRNGEGGDCSLNRPQTKMNGWSLVPSEKQGWHQHPKYLEETPSKESPPPLAHFGLRNQVLKSMESFHDYKNFEISYKTRGHEDKKMDHTICNSHFDAKNEISTANNDLNPRRGKALYQQQNEAFTTCSPHLMSLENTSQVATPTSLLLHRASTLTAASYTANRRHMHVFDPEMLSDQCFLSKLLRGSNQENSQHKRNQLSPLLGRQDLCYPRFSPLPTPCPRWVQSFLNLRPIAEVRYARWRASTEAPLQRSSWSSMSPPFSTSEGGVPGVSPTGRLVVVDPDIPGTYYTSRSTNGGCLQLSSGAMETLNPSFSI